MTRKIINNYYQQYICRSCQITTASLHTGAVSYQKNNAFQGQHLKV
jgi:hypothetical protein